MGPTTNESAAGTTGERLLPVERLLGSQGARAASESGRQAPEGGRQSGRRTLRLAPEEADGTPDTAV
ncbi:hypothetical protein ADK58_01355 [Streptomyces sp. XY152]|nr:hypothetical protein ADK58_01355 [Streptomyces sp. XY152]